MGKKKRLKKQKEVFVAIKGNGGLVVQTERGSNVKQMRRIAENCGLTGKEKKRFFQAVRALPFKNKWEASLCYESSQAFKIYSDLGAELSYREGFCIHFPDKPYHAWLEWNGKILDLILGYCFEPNPDAYIPLYEGNPEEGNRHIKEMWEQTGMMARLIDDCPSMRNNKKERKRFFALEKRVMDMPVIRPDVMYSFEEAA